MAMQSLAEQVMDKIMDLVAERRLEPGDKLPTEKDLTELFGVGRSTVREAIVQLQNLGVLSVRQGRGTFLKEVSTHTLLENQNPLYKFVDLKREELQDVMDVRKLLETEIVKLVVNRIDDDGIELLQKSLEKHMNANDSFTAYEHDLEFHKLLANMSENSILPLTLNVVLRFLDRYGTIVARTLDIPEYAEKILEQHRQIFLAIQARDEKGAVEAMLRHLNTSQVAILTSFDIFAERKRLNLA